MAWSETARKQASRDGLVMECDMMEADWTMVEPYLVEAGTSAHG